MGEQISIHPQKIPFMRRVEAVITTINDYPFDYNSPPFWAVAHALGNAERIKRERRERYIPDERSHVRQFFEPRLFHVIAEAWKSGQAARITRKFSDPMEAGEREEKI